MLHKVAQVVCEATGTYYLDMAFAIDVAKVPLMVANPRQIRDYIKACKHNGQTDSSDADHMADFARRMRFEPWVAPSDDAFALHKLGRAIGSKTKRHTALLNQLHAAKATRATPKSILGMLQRELIFIERERDKLTASALKIIGGDQGLKSKFHLLVSIPGIAQTSALAILAELMVLPPGLAGKAWVKYAGLDPMKKTSGTSVNTKTRIAKRGNARLRGALYMPALSSKSHDPHMRQFAEKLIANHKAPIAAVVAVQRKLLLAIHAMFRTNSTWKPTTVIKTT